MTLVLAFSPVSIKAEENLKKAVSETSPTLGFRISEVALKNLGVAMFKIPSPSSVYIPASSFVYFQDNVGIYRVRDGWFKLIVLKSVNPKGITLRVDGGDFRPNDLIVLKGAALLRVTEMDAFGGEG